MNEKIKMDIEKMQAAVEQLKAGGEELFADQIEALQNKIDALKAEAAAEVEKAVDEVDRINQILSKNTVLASLGQLKSHSWWSFYTNSSDGSQSSLCKFLCYNQGKRKRIKIKAPLIES